MNCRIKQQMTVLAAGCLIAVSFGIATHAHGMNANHEKMTAEMNLTETQMASHDKLAKLQAEMEKEHDAFAKSLTDEQQAILKKMGHGATHAHGMNANHEKMTAEMNLTETQMASHDKLAKLQAEMEKEHDAFAKSLTDEQQAILKKIGHGATHAHGMNANHEE